MEKVEQPLEIVLGEIERALEGGFFYLALVASLSIPDICAGLELQSRPRGQDYMAWYDKNVVPRYKFLTGDDCYRIRCGVVHQGKLGHPKLKYDRVMFMLPNQKMSGGMVRVKLASGEEIAQLDLKQFCTAIISSARTWFEANQTNQNVISNLPNLVRLRAGGFGMVDPYPVIT